MIASAFIKTAIGPAAGDVTLGRVHLRPHYSTRRCSQVPLHGNLLEKYQLEMYLGVTGKYEKHRMQIMRYERLSLRSKKRVKRACEAIL